jgi:flagellar biosynthesis GTPase FlhF
MKNFFLTFMICVFAGNLYAVQTLFLRTGEFVKVNVTKQTEDEIFYNTLDGTSHVISKTKVVRIVFKDVEEAEKKELLKKLKLEEEALKKKAEEEAKAKALKEKEEAEKKLAEEKQKAIEKEKEAQAKAKKEEEEKQKNAELAKQKENEEKSKSLAKERAEEQWARSQLESGITKSGAVWRSLILPGWGHSYSHHKTEAYTFGGLFWLSFANVLYKTNEAQSEIKAYESLSNNYNSIRTAYNNQEIQNLLIYGSEYPATTNIANFSTFGYLYFNTLKETKNQAIQEQNQAVLTMGIIYLLQAAHAGYSVNKLPWGMNVAIQPGVNSGASISFSKDF